LVNPQGFATNLSFSGGTIMSTTLFRRLGAGVTALAASAALGVVAPTSAEAASTFPSCTKAISGKKATGHCSPRANGDSFLFKVSVQCRWWTLTQGWNTTMRYSGYAGPGQTTSISCKTNESAIWVGIIVTG